jgi:hypothetical protein
MTTPEERQRAQAETRRLLRELRDTSLTPGVPDRLRHRAEGLLRHLATPSEIGDVLEMTLRLVDAERERDQRRAIDAAATRQTIFRISLALAAAFVVGILVAECALR